MSSMNEYGRSSVGQCTPVNNQTKEVAGTEKGNTSKNKKIQCVEEHELCQIVGAQENSVRDIYTGQQWFFNGRWWWWHGVA